MTDTPQSKNMLQRLLLPSILLIICLGVAGGSYWFLMSPESEKTKTSEGHPQPVAQHTSQSPAALPPAEHPSLPSVPLAPQEPYGTEGGLPEQHLVPPVLHESASVNATLPALPREANATALPSTQNATSTVEPAEEMPTAPENVNAISPADESAESPQAPEEQAPVILYGKGKPTVQGPHVVQGEVPDAASSVDTKTIYGSGKTRGRAEDSIIRMDFITSLARFLAENYWPTGTHPLARSAPASTADVKWANLKYGVHLEGFHISKSAPETARRKVLHYVLMPSMIKGLYQLYSERFIAALSHEAATKQRLFDGKERPLTLQETALMFGLYAEKSRALAEAMRAYLNNDQNPYKVNVYLQREEEALTAYLRYSEALSQHRSAAAAASIYQRAVVLREQAREAVAASLRKGGNTRGLDTESLLFIALWMHRRSIDDTPALYALTDVLQQCSERMAQEKIRYLNMPATPPVSSSAKALD